MIIKNSGAVYLMKMSVIRVECNIKGRFLYETLIDISSLQFTGKLQDGG